MTHQHRRVASPFRAIDAMVVVYSPKQRGVAVLTDHAAATWMALEVPRSSAELIAAINGESATIPATECGVELAIVTSSELEAALADLRKAGLVHP